MCVSEFFLLFVSKRSGTLKLNCATECNILVHFVACELSWVAAFNTNTNIAECSWVKEEKVQWIGVISANREEIQTKTTRKYWLETLFTRIVGQQTTRNKNILIDPKKAKEWFSYC